MRRKTVEYVSTRGKAPLLPFDDVLLAGLARDGGLYVPETWPLLSADDIRAFQGMSYADLAVRVMSPFIGGTIPEADFADLVKEAYLGFSHPAVAPLKELNRNDWLLELFHGPTLAFKDYAMQLLGRLFDYVLTRRGQKALIVGATSGDTGSAAIEAFRDRAATQIVILHPKGRVSEVQRRQMTTVGSANVYNLAIEGTFDDCQDLVKAMFNDLAFRDEMALSGVNSINWARIMAQIVYYFAAASALGAPDREVAFSVPSGNFGNVFAGYAAARMGLPIAQLVVGSNRNDILAQFFRTATMTIGSVEPTLSPSMDIQISSNFERLLFELHKRNGAEIVTLMENFRKDGRLQVADDVWRTARTLFDGASFDDTATTATIARVYAETGELLDPHSAIGVAAGREARKYPAVPMVSLATAHPAKFPDAVKAASGLHPALPAALADLFERKERYHVLPNESETVKAFVRDIAQGRIKEEA